MSEKTQSVADTGSASEGNGFDSYEVSLGDLMRGERATMGKSLLDVERELKIKAVYISAIENADPDAFETPGFIPGYVRSYARYLGMNPDQAFDVFCAESGFRTAHGMSAEASGRRAESGTKFTPVKQRVDDVLFKPGTSFLPEEEGFLARIEPGALGSTVVLLGLIAVIGYGGWSVLNEMQKVRMAPVEGAPEVLADLDPVTGRETSSEANTDDVVAAARSDRLDRLYRPQALDAPVLVARDAPIATLNPAEVGTLPVSRPTPVATVQGPPPADGMSTGGVLQAQLGPVPGLAAGETPTTPQVIEAPRPDLQIVAVRPSWVRIRSADETVIFEGIMNAGDTFDVPQTEEPATLKAGESGSVYFALGSQLYGPAGQRGAVTSNISLSPSSVAATFTVAQVEADKDLSSYVAQLEAPAPQVPAGQ